MWVEELTDHPLLWDFNLELDLDTNAHVTHP
jgi:hypothetical protein